jgi:hypothetical protein
MRIHRHAGAAAAVAMLMLAAPPAVGTQQRPFQHDRHERVLCRECHGTAARHGTVLVRSARDCAGCHHDERRGFDCTACHAASQLPSPRPLVASMSLAVYDAPRSRELPFAHAQHAVVACRDCHRTPVTLAMDRACADCHAGHHRAAAECSSCHNADPRPAHRAEAHLGCGVAGCHAVGSAPAPASSRTLCLLCHPEQRAHEPGATCAGCHRIPATRPAPGTLEARR